jgi:hypothetical protein
MIASQIARLTSFSHHTYGTSHLKSTITLANFLFQGEKKIMLLHSDNDPKVSFGIPLDVSETLSGDP